MYSYCVHITNYKHKLGFIIEEIKLLLNVQQFMSDIEALF